MYIFSIKQDGWQFGWGDPLQKSIGGAEELAQWDFSLKARKGYACSIVRLTSQTGMLFYNVYLSDPVILNGMVILLTD